MAYIKYPETLPCPTWEYTSASSSFARRTLYDNGWTRQRRQWPGDLGLTANLSFIMDTQTFEKWGKFISANGWNWFVMDLDSPEGTPTKNLVRQSAPYQYIYDDYDRVSTTMPIEITPGGWNAVP